MLWTYWRVVTSSEFLHLFSFWLQITRTFWNYLWVWNDIGRGVKASSCSSKDLDSCGKVAGKLSWQPPIATTHGFFGAKIYSTVPKFESDQDPVGKDPLTTTIFQGQIRCLNFAAWRIISLSKC